MGLRMEVLASPPNRFLHHRHHRTVAGYMEMITRVVGKRTDDVAEHWDALLWLKASSEEDVQLAVDKARINLLLYYAHAVVDDGRIGSEALLIRLAYRIGDADVGVMANEVWLYERGDGRQTGPEAGVVDGADDACAAKEEGEEARKGVNTHVGCLRVDVYDVGMPAQHDVEHAQGKEYGGYALEDEVEIDVGH